MFALRLVFILFFISFSLFADGIKIKSIQLSGLTYISEDLFFARLFKYIKKDVPVDTEFILSKISELNLFDKINLYRVKKKLKVFLEEKPVINDVEVYSDKDLTNILSLLNSCGLRSGNFYDVDKIIKFKMQAKDNFVSGGFNNYDIDFKVRYLHKNNRVNLHVNILKVFPQKVKSIDILGVKSFNKRKLISKLSYSKKSWMHILFREQLFLQSDLDSSIDILKKYYSDKGFSDFQVEFAKVFLSDDFRHVHIVICISEGERYRIGTLEVVDAQHLLKSDKVYNECWDIINSSIKRGAFFSKESVLEAKDALKVFLVDSNIKDVDVYYIAFYTSEAILQVDFVFSKFKRSRIRHINFTGNVVTCDTVLRQMVSPLEGSYLIVDEIEDAKEEMIRNSISENITVEYVKDIDNSDDVDIIFEISEQGFSKFSAGFTYCSDEGININLTGEFTNFLGLGTDITLDIINNGEESDIAFTFFVPRFFGDKVGVGYKIFYKSDILDPDYDDISFMSETYGVYLYYSFEIDKFTRFNFGVGTELTDVFVFDEFLTEEMRIFSERFGCDFIEYYFNIIWSYNSLDRFFYPNNGTFHSLVLRFNLPESSFLYFNITYDLNYYKNFFDDYTFNIFSSIYYGRPYFEDDTYPFYKNFHIKAPNNIRGFKERAIGPKDSEEDSVGGNLLFCTKISIFVPVMYGLKDLKASVFFDIGNVYETLQEPIEFEVEDENADANANADADADADIDFDFDSDADSLDNIGFDFTVNFNIDDDLDFSGISHYSYGNNIYIRFLENGELLELQSEHEQVIELAQDINIDLELNPHLHLQPHLDLGQDQELFQFDYDSDLLDDSSSISSIQFAFGVEDNVLYYRGNCRDDAYAKDLASIIRALKFAFGISLIWDTPFGLPLEIALACPFNFDDDDSISIVSFSFGL